MLSGARPDNICMTLAETSLAELSLTEQFFNNSTRELTEDLSGFAPVEGMMTAAQQVAHCAKTIDWFVEGAFRPEGFDLNFDEHIEDVMKVSSLAAAREWFAKSIANAKAAFGSKTDEELMTPMPAGPVMGGAPRFHVISGITDHTSHHRGALTVYARLSGKVPPMPYM
jgi:uncharacterized damage-inducible protein DinB